MADGNASSFFFSNIVFGFFFFKFVTKTLIRYSKLLVINSAKRVHEIDTLELYPWAH